MSLEILHRRRVAQASNLSFVDISGITNPTQISAVNQLETDLKTNNLWDKMYAVYPLVGGTANSHKFNLKDPRDTDSAFRLTITGGANSGSGYEIGSTPVDTHFNPRSRITDFTNAHISGYSSSIPSNFQIGCHSSDPVSFRLFNSSIYAADIIGSFGNGRVQGSVITTIAGFMLGSRTSNILSALFRNNTKLNTSTQTNASAINPDKNVEISGSGVVVSFASIGKGLSDAEASILYTIVQNYQTTLGRQV